MIYKYTNKNSKETIILLHGTGGNEESLFTIGKLINPNANLLGIKGNVNENGLNRFFKRFKLGLYDLESYHLELNKLTETIINLSEKYNFNLNNTTIIGFSNGANIASGLLSKDNLKVKNYGLLSADLIDPNLKLNDLSNKNIFLSYSFNDPFVKIENFNGFIRLLKNKNANLNLMEISGHLINENLINNLKSWYELYK